MAVTLSRPDRTLPQPLNLWLLVLCLSSAAPLEAQQAEEIIPEPPLVFDPVLIEYRPLNAMTELDLDNLVPDTYQVVELSALPSLQQQIPRQDSPGIMLRDLITTTPSQYRDSIQAFELEGGVYDYRLSEAYLGLGAAYQQLNEHELALEAFEQALQVTRINLGLYDAAQLPIVSEMVESYLSMGNFAAANQRQEYLIFVQQKVYGPNHPIHIIRLLEYADWNLRAASLRLGYIPNQEALNLRSSPFEEFDIDFRDPEGMGLAVTQLVVASNAYYQALSLQRNRERFIRNLDSDEVASIETEFSFSEDDLSIPRAENKLAYVHFLLARVYQNIPTSVTDADFYYRNFRDGQEALERRFVYLQNSQTAPGDVIKALLDIADWLLLFERWNSAEEIYAEVISLRDSYAIEDINGLSYRDLPEAIPNFVTNQFSRSNNNLAPNEPLDYAGYIDVSFELSRLAKANRVEIINASAGTTPATEDALMSMLRRANFRLQLEDEDSAFEYSENNYLVRYYYTKHLE